MASLTRWTWVWAGSRRQWRTGRPGVLQSMGWVAKSLTWLSYWTTAKHSSSTLKGPAALLTDCSCQEGAAEGTAAAGGGEPREKGLQSRSCQDWREEQEEMNRQTSSASSTGQALCQAFYKNYFVLIKKTSDLLLYSTGNYIQYPWINHNGKEYKKECIYVYHWVTMPYSRN